MVESINLPTETEVFSNVEIDRLLAKVAQEAQEDISHKNDHSSFGPEVKKFKDLAIAIYDAGSKIKAIFGLKKPEAEGPNQKPQKLD
ncbi:MAG: hypothetical protein LBR11_05570 [Deltaproteobacteria bacterium]|nr:hypothetical protein [Deltaproteobacteria bacterium]